jgi:hypothetical protein
MSKYSLEKNKQLEIKYDKVRIKYEEVGVTVIVLFVNLVFIFRKSAENLKEYLLIMNILSVHPSVIF